MAGIAVEHSNREYNFDYRDLLFVDENRQIAEDRICLGKFCRRGTARKRLLSPSARIVRGYREQNPHCGIGYVGDSYLFRHGEVPPLASWTQHWRTPTPPSSEVVRIHQPVCRRDAQFYRWHINRRRMDGQS